MSCRLVDPYTTRAFLCLSLYKREKPSANYEEGFSCAETVATE